MNTRKILLAPAIAVVLLAGTACGNDDAADTGTEDIGATADDGALADPIATDDPMGMGDAGAPGETLALVMAVDEHEIAMAEQAREKGVTGDVLAYADMLHTEHSANLEKDRQVAESAGLSPMETEAVQAQKEKGHAVMERLAALDGEEYADAYVDAMVQGHTEALAMLDERMGMGATDGGNDQALQQHLSMARDAIANHLEMGETLQGDDQAAGE